MTILEARDRIGGRAHQATLPSGHLVDLGPNWIHGTEDNPILDLAKETGTTTHSWGEQNNIFDEDGKFLENSRVLNDELWGFIVQACEVSPLITSFSDIAVSWRWRHRYCDLVTYSLT